MAAGKPRTPLSRAIEKAYDKGLDWWVFDFGYTLLALREAGQDNYELTAAADEMVVARMEVGLPYGDWYRP